jgi:hypothetical protein
MSDYYTLMVLVSPSIALRFSLRTWLVHVIKKCCEQSKKKIENHVTFGLQKENQTQKNITSIL